MRFSNWKHENVESNKPATSNKIATDKYFLISIQHVALVFIIVGIFYVTIT